MALTPVSVAITFINLHDGMFAFECAEGLVLRSELVLPSSMAPLFNIEQDDRVEEELQVFPIYELSSERGVSLQTIKQYMGY